MAVLPPPKPLPTISLIYDTYRQQPPRPHLGASQIGEECTRKLWYAFRFCLYPQFDQRILRLFETGQKEEARILENLRKAGIQIWDRDGQRQISFQMFGGHYSGSVDAIGKGFPESQKPHVIEIKTSNTKNFKALKKNGVQISNHKHYCQMMQYMKWSNLDRAYYICVCKDTDEIYGERIHFDKDFAQSLESKAHYIICASNPPDKLGESETDFRCKFCEFKRLCWNDNLPEINCRTCCHSNPSKIDGWECERHKHPLSVQQQFVGCDSHIFIPSLVPLEVVDADAEKGTVTYAGGLINGPGAMSSEEFKCNLTELSKSE